MRSESTEPRLPDRLPRDPVVTARLQGSKPSDPFAAPRSSQGKGLLDESALDAALEAQIDAEIAHLIRLRLRKEAARLKKL